MVSAVVFRSGLLRGDEVGRQHLMDLLSYLSLPPWEPRHASLQGPSRQQPSADAEPASTLILDFSVSRCVRNKFMMFMNYTVSDVL